MSSSQEENNIKITGVYKERKQSNVKSFLFVFFLMVLIIITIVLAGFFGNEFVTFYVFILIFGLPLILVYKDSILWYMPKNISTWFIGDLHETPGEIHEEIENQVGDVSDTVQSVYKQEYQTLILGILGYVASIYLLIKKRTEFIGILMSAFFAVLSQIILGDLF